MQDEEEVSVELIEERERAIRQLEVCETFFSLGFIVGCRSQVSIFYRIA